MKALIHVAIMAAIVACATLGYDAAASALHGAVTHGCEGFKPETRALCWEDRL